MEVIPDILSKLYQHFPSLEVKKKTKFVLQNFALRYYKLIITTQIYILSSGDAVAIFDSHKVIFQQYRDIDIVQQ